MLSAKKQPAEEEHTGDILLFVFFLTFGSLSAAYFTIEGIFAWVVYSYILVCELREQEDHKKANEKDFGGPKINSSIPV